jgi:hypothetical protein
MPVSRAAMVSISAFQSKKPEFNPITKFLDFRREFHPTHAEFATFSLRR